MEKSIEKLYGKLQDENLELMIKHVNQQEIASPIEVKEIRINHVLLTKLGQMQRALKNIPAVKY